MGKNSEEFESAIKKAIGIGDLPSLKDALRMCKALEKVDSVSVAGPGVTYAEEKVLDVDNFNTAHALNRQIRAKASVLVKTGGGADALRLYYNSHLFDAPYNFDSFCIYLEKDREPQRKFYMPRRKQLLQVAEALQDLEDGKLYLLAISMPPGVGKTTLAEFFLAWECGKHPELPNLIGSHSYPFVDGMFSEMQRIFDPGGEYRFNDVFPNVRVIKTSAKMRMIDLGYAKTDAKRFGTLQFGTINSGLAGRVRAMNLLYCDDLVDGIEAALSRDRMDKLWFQYHTDLRQRMVGNNTRELHIATRWSVHDVIGRLEREYEGDESARFIRLPALNEDDESNFDYPYGLGYSTAQLLEQRDIMDDASWRALYMNEPIERLGVLYSPEELRRYFALPEQEPDAILAICDTKEQGSDYCVMPVFYQYGKDFYMDSIICDNGKVEVLEERVAQTLTDKLVNKCRIESNRGGTLFAANVQKRVDELGGITTITTKWTQSNKETRIEMNAGYIKSHVLFKDESVYAKDKEYREAMNMLYGYTIMGKNKNDDVPDVLSMFVDFVATSATNRVSIVKRPF